MMPAEVEGSNDVAVGDVDGDGDVDLLIGNDEGAELARLLLNDGTGVFRDATDNLPSSPFRTYAVGLADVDGDGDLDAFLGKGAYDAGGWKIGAQNRLFLNDGAGGFSNATANLPALPDFTTALAFGDLDGDGDEDLMLGNEYLFSFPPLLITEDTIWLNDGTGTFTDHVGDLPSNYDMTTAIALGDVDGDGDLDALYTKGLGADRRLYLNDGSAVFTDASANLPAVLDSNFTCVLEDVDGDGDLDIFSGGHLFANNGAGVFSNFSGGIPGGAANSDDLSMGDVDGDGDLDALLVDDRRNRLYLGDGAGGFVTASGNLPPNVFGTRAAVLADVDDDADVDAILMTGQQNLLQLGDGTGQFGMLTPVYVPAMAGRCGMADVNGDGHADIVLVQYGQDMLFYGDGIGGFADASGNMPVESSYGRVLAFADVEGDGDLDILVGNYEQPNFLYENDGAGVFTIATGALPGESASTSAIGIGDLDGDGDLDAFVGSSATPDLKFLYLNDGSGTFTDASANFPDAYHYAINDVALADLDGDGDLDIMMALTSSNVLYLNDGTAHFTTGTAPYNTRSNAVEVCDVDADGDLDLFFGCAMGPDRLYKNNGNGVFTGVAFPNVRADTEDAVFFDADGDGDEDILAVAGGNHDVANHLYLNNGGGVFSDGTSLLATRPK